MTATPSSLLRRTLLAVIIALILMFGLFAKAQTVPLLKVAQCSTIPIEIQVANIRFKVNCADAASKKNEDDDEKTRKFVLFLGVIDLGVIADNILHDIPVDPQDLTEVKARIDELCIKISCERFRESDNLKRTMSPKEVPLFIIEVLRDNSIVEGAKSDSQ